MSKKPDGKQAKPITISSAHRAPVHSHSTPAPHLFSKGIRATTDWAGRTEREIAERDRKERGRGRSL